MYPELSDDAEAAAKAGRRELLRRASEKLGADEVILHTLRPEDVGAANAAGYGTVNITTGNSFTDAVASGGNTIANNRWLLIYGFANNEAVREIDLVRINRGQSTARKWNVRSLSMYQNNAGWSNQPVIVNDNTNVTLSFAAASTNTAADFAFLGEVADRRGSAINP